MLAMVTTNSILDGNTNEAIVVGVDDGRKILLTVAEPVPAAMNPD